MKNLSKMNEKRDLEDKKVTFPLKKKSFSTKLTVQG